MLLKCPAHLGLRTVNELLKWEDLYQLICQNSWSILSQFFSLWSRKKCCRYPIWEQNQPIIYYLMVTKMTQYLEFLVLILRLQMESCRVHFCFAVVSYVCTKIQAQSKCNPQDFFKFKGRKFIIDAFVSPKRRRNVGLAFLYCFNAENHPDL